MLTEREERHGKWLDAMGDGTLAECSVCGEVFEAVDESESEDIAELWDCYVYSYRYCPNCGARMDGKTVTLDEVER